MGTTYAVRFRFLRMAIENRALIQSIGLEEAGVFRYRVAIFLGTGGAVVLAHRVGRGPGRG